MPPTVDRIELTGLRAVGTIGVLPEEQSRPQPFELDLVLEVDARAAGRTDDLEHSVDYGVAIDLASKVVEREPTLLLERVATRVAEELLDLARVRAVEVVVRKLRPPVPQDIASTAVRIRRSRADLVMATSRATTAYVALGSNLGDREAHLRHGLAGLPGVVATSSVYETEPVGGPDQGPYLNMVAELSTELDPFSLLRHCLAVEAGAGRERVVRWGARTLDLDVLLWGDARIESAELTVPHPRMWERRFVVQPLAEVAPHVVPDDWDQRLPAGGITRLGPLV